MNINFPKEKPISFMTTVVRCNHCHTWYCRFPSFFEDGLDGDFAECEKCGCTSFVYSKGRPVGNHSHLYENYLKEWNEEKLYWNEYPDFIQERKLQNIKF